MIKMNIAGNGTWAWNMPSCYGDLGRTQHCFYSVPAKTHDLNLSVGKVSKLVVK